MSKRMLRSYSKSSIHSQTSDIPSTNNPIESAATRQPTVEDDEDSAPGTVKPPTKSMLFGRQQTTETTKSTETPTEQTIEEPFNLQETVTITFEHYHKLQEQIRVLEAELNQKNTEAKQYWSCAEKYKAVVKKATVKASSLEEQLTYNQQPEHQLANPQLAVPTIEDLDNIDPTPVSGHIPAPPTVPVRLGIPEPRDFPRNTTDTATTQASDAATWRPRGEKPREPLSSDNPDGYTAWCFVIETKFEIDLSLYSNDRSKISYALRQMTNALFEIMMDYVANIGDPTFNDFMDELEHYLGIHLLEDKARRELLNTKQSKKETVTQYFQRLVPLWTRAHTPEADKVYKFKHSLLPYITNYLSTHRFRTVREVLDMARTVEQSREEVDYNFPRNTNPGPQTAKPRVTPPNTGAISTRTAITAGPAGRRPNTTRSPVAVKPNDWNGAWYDPQPRPAKLTPEERITLQQQGRCWACRGSGHRASDACCPRHVTRNPAINEISTQALVEEISDSDNGGKD